MYAVSGPVLELPQSQLELSAAYKYICKFTVLSSGLSNVPWLEALTLQILFANQFDGLLFISNPYSWIITRQKQAKRRCILKTTLTA